MKIGLVTGEYPPMQGGVGDFTRELARALNALGHEAQVVTGAGQEAGSKVEDTIVVRRVIDQWGVRCWRQIADVVKQNQLEVLNIQYEPVAYAMRVGVNFLVSPWVRRRVRVPIVTTFHDLLVPYLFPKAGSLRWRVVEYLARHSDAVIVTNGEDRARLSNLQPHPTGALSNGGASQSPITNLQTIPIGSNIDPDQVGEFSQMAERARWNVKLDEYLLGYFGFLNLSKGGSDLMQALKALGEAGLPVKLLLIGGRTGSSDPENAVYAAQVDRLIELADVQGRVISTGYLDARDVSRALLACDVLVLPYVDGASLRRGSLLAAIAHGRAIVTTEPRYPIEGLMHEQSAVFVPPNDPAALANAIRRVLLDASLRGQLERGAREAARLYTWDRIAAQTVAVLQHVLKQ